MNLSWQTSITCISHSHAYEFSALEYCQILTNISLVCSGTPSGNASSYAPKSSVALANLDNLIRGTHHLPASGLTRLGSVSGGAITTQENEKEKIAKWTAVFGAEDYTIVVAQLCKFHEGGGLGISLEGTVGISGLAPSV